MFANRTQSRRAFTLVEIMCVMVIIAIAAAVVVVELSSRDDLKASAAARIVISDLLYAQNRAIATQTMHYVDCTVASGGDSGGYSIYDATPFATPIAHPINRPNNYVVQFGSGGTNGLDQAQITAANFDSASVLAFDQLGAPYSYSPGGTAAPLNSGILTITAGSQSLTITVRPSTGEITVQ